MPEIVVGNQPVSSAVRPENVVVNQVRLTDRQRDALQLLVQGQSLSGRVHGKTYNRLIRMRLIEDQYTITDAGRVALGVTPTSEYQAWDENATLACTPANLGPDKNCRKCGGRGTVGDHNGERYVEVECDACGVQASHESKEQP